MPKLKLFLFLILVVILVGCAEEVIDPTPTQEVPLYPCPGYPGAEFTPLDTNPCLQGASSREIKMLTDYWGSATQYKPEYYTIVSNPLNVEGYEDEYSDHATIEHANGVYTFDFTNINGEWGFTSKSVVMNEGCHLVKVTGSSDITTETAWDFFLKGYLQLSTEPTAVQIKSHGLAVSGEWEHIWVYKVTSPIIATFSTTIQVAWNSSPENGRASIYSIFITEAPDGYCDGGVMEFGG
jgi:hypothetical protein